MEATHVETGAVRIMEITGACVHAACPDQQVRNVKFDVLPSVDAPFERPNVEVRRRRLRIPHVANDPDPVGTVGHRHIGVHVDPGVAPDCLDVNVAQVAQVEQIVVDQFERRLVVIYVALELVAWIIMPGMFGSGNRRLCPGCACHPDPNDVIALFHGICSDACLFWDLFLPGNFETMAGWIEQEPVITAANAVAFERPQRKRSVTMAATVFECGGPSVAPEQDHRPVEQRSCDGFVLQFPRERCDVPLIERKHSGSISFLIFFTASAALA